MTWLDFLRTAGGTVRNEDNYNYTLPDRKRRHAGSSPERRGYPYPVYNPSVTGRRPSGLSTVLQPLTAGSSREYVYKSCPKGLEISPAIARLVQLL